VQIYNSITINITYLTFKINYFTPNHKLKQNELVSVIYLYFSVQRPPTFGITSYQFNLSNLWLGYLF